MNTYFYIENNDEPLKREKLQNLFDNSFQKMDTKSLRAHYQMLRKLEFDSLLNFVFENVDISSLVENITLACDVICAENNTSFIYCGNSTSYIKGNVKLITKAVLNLLSNAYIYSRGNLVTVKTLEKQDFVSIEIQSGGNLSPSFNFGDGLSFVKKVCDSLDGYFFIESANQYTKAIMMLPKSRVYKESVHTPDIFDFLTDRLSPIYVEFFGQK